MGQAGIIIAIAVMILAGSGLFRALSGKGSYFSTPENIAYSFAAGMGCVTLELLVAGLFGWQVGPLGLGVPWVVLAGVIALLTAKKRGEGTGISEEGLSCKKGFAWYAMLCVLVTQIGSVFLRAVSRPIESYDAIVNFAIKSKIMFLNGSITPAPGIFEGIGKGHQDYPLLLPMVQTWIYEFMGGHNDVIVKLVYPLVLVALLVCIYGYLKRLFSRGYALFFVFLLGTIPQVVNFAAIAYADLTFTLMVTLSCIMLFEYFRTERPFFMAISSVFLVSAMLSKNEGLSFCIASFSVLSLHIAGRIDKGKETVRVLKYFIVPFVIMLFPWILFKIRLGSHNSDIELSRMSMERLLENMGYIPFIMNKFQQEVFQPKKWNIFWVMVLASTVLRSRKFADETIRMLGVFILINAAVYFASNMVITGKDLYFHVNTTLSRFMIHFTGISLIFMAHLLWDDMRKIPFFAVCKSPEVERG